MVFITHESAWEFWMAYRGATPSSCLKCRSKLPANGSHETAEFVERLLHRYDGIGDGLQRLGISSKPLHVLVPGDSPLRDLDGISFHRLTRKLPRKSFFEVAPGIAVVSPELCFVQAARKANLIEAVLHGYELCARYRIATSVVGSRSDIIELRQPITDVDRIRSFITSYYAERSHCVPISAVRYIAAGAAESPMEIRLVMSLCLPTSVGGYRLPLPVLNEEVRVGALASAFSQRKTLRCDLYWPDRKVDVEYDSDDCHVGSRQRGADANRWVVLDKMGIELVPVTTWQFGHREEFDIVVRSIRAKLGLRDRKPGGDTSWRRFSLRKELLRIEDSTCVFGRVR